MPRIFHVSNARPDNKSQLFRLCKIRTWIVRALVDGIGANAADSFRFFSLSLLVDAQRAPEMPKFFSILFFLECIHIRSRGSLPSFCFIQFQSKSKMLLPRFLNETHVILSHLLPRTLRHVYLSFENIPFNWLAWLLKVEESQIFSHRSMRAEAADVDVCAWNMHSDSVCAPSISVEPPTKYPYRFNLSPFKRNKIIIWR